MFYDLPTSVNVCGADYEIRSDYRAILDIIIALNDPNLTDAEKALVMLDVFYVDFRSIPQDQYEQAIKECQLFIDCGQDAAPAVKRPRLMDWEQDFPLIVNPVNRVLGKEIRAEKYLHWWTFISAYYEIGDCLFSQVVGIRDKKRRGKKLDKADQEFLRRNADLVNFKTVYTDAETDILKAWT